MRILLLSLLLSTAGVHAFSGTYGDALVEYYDFEIVRHSNGNYMWAWRNPSTGLRIYHQWTAAACKDASVLEANPPIVTYRISDNMPVFWVYVPFYPAWGGYSEDNLLAARSLYNTANLGSHPLDDAVLVRYSLRTSHPDEYVDPTRPDPEEGGEGESGTGGGYDYRGRLDKILFFLSVIASSVGLLLGLFLWRLVVLSKSQREL